MLLRLKQDFSLSALSAGFVAVLIGFASAMAIVFQAAQAAGASPEMIVSWVWALGIGMGLGCIGLSFYYKRPIIIAWSTPGAALLASSLTNASIEEAIGIFVFVAILILIVGVTGIFDRLTKSIPLALASAMLAGILVQFGLGVFTSLQTEPVLVILMLATYLLSKRLVPRYAIMAVLAVGFIYCFWQQTLNFEQLTFELAKPIWVTPSFEFSTLIGIGIPLFIVTMTSQNLPGVATLKASGYAQQPVSPVLTATGGINLILAPFGGFTFNLAAITAAICTSEEAHPDPKRRYIAGISTGIFNLIAGLFAATVVGLFAMFPSALIAALAGLALLGTIGVSLNSALASDKYRDAALITFLVTASGITFLGIASAFWGIILGLIAQAMQKRS